MPFVFYTNIANKRIRSFGFYPQIHANFSTPVSLVQEIFANKSEWVRSCLSFCVRLRLLLRSSARNTFHAKAAKSFHAKGATGSRRGAQRGSRRVDFAV